MSFEEAYENFKIYAKSRHKKQGFETITKNFDNHILPYFVGRNVENLTKLDIINWQNQICDFDFSNNFNSALYSSFSSFIKYCVYCGYLDTNIVLEVENFRRKYEVKKYDYYNLFEFLRFRYFLDSRIYKSFYSFMFFYGTRPGETMALRFSDVRGKWVYIRHNLQRRGKRNLDTPKNESSIRFIKINIFMRFSLFLLKRYYIKSFGNGIDYFIFGGNKPLSTTTLDRYKSKACSKAHLREITQHQFRHSYATRMIHKGVPIDYVSKSLGHSKVSMTLDVYLHNEKRMRGILPSMFN